MTASRDRQKGQFTAPGVERECYSVKELAYATGYSQDTIYRRIRSGEIPHFMMCGEKRVPASWLNALIAEAESVVAS